MSIRTNHIIAWDYQENPYKTELVASTKPVFTKITLEEYEIRSYEVLEPGFEHNPRRALITKHWVENVHIQLSQEIEARKQRLLKDNAIPVEVILEGWGDNQIIANMARGRLAVFLASDIIKTLNDSFTLLDKSQIATMESDAQVLFRWASFLPDAPKEHVVQKDLKEACKLATARSQAGAANNAQTLRKALGPKESSPDLLALKINGCYTIN